MHMLQIVHCCLILLIVVNHETLILLSSVHVVCQPESAFKRVLAYVSKY